jgi:hypothetical protein
MLRTLDVKDLFTLKGVTERCVRTAPLKSNAILGASRTKTILALPAGLMLSRVAAPSVTRELSSRKRVVNQRKNNPRDSKGRIAGCFCRHGNDFQNLRRAIRHGADHSVTGRVRGEFDAGLLVAVVVTKRFTAAFARVQVAVASRG